jgi:hypothetical protein
MNSTPKKYNIELQSKMRAFSLEASLLATL